MSKRIQVRNLTAKHVGRVAKIDLFDDEWHKIVTIEHSTHGTWLELEDNGHSDVWATFEYGDNLIEFKEEV